MTLPMTEARFACMEKHLRHPSSRVVAELGVQPDHDHHGSELRAREGLAMHGYHVLAHEPDSPI